MSAPIRRAVESRRYDPVVVILPVGGGMSCCQVVGVMLRQEHKGWTGGKKEGTSDSVVALFERRAGIVSILSPLSAFPLKYT
jgi:hypothetical protein